MIRIQKISEEQEDKIFKRLDEIFNNPEELSTVDEIIIEPIPRGRGFIPYSEFTEEEKEDVERRMKILEEALNDPEKRATMMIHPIEPIPQRKRD